MTLKEQIEATIQAYQKACKPQNANFIYTIFNNLERGICNYCAHNYYDELRTLLKNQFNSDFMTSVPLEKIFNRDLDISQMHQTRINFLQNLLAKLTNEKH